MARAAKSEEAILQREFITKTDIKMLFNVGERKAATIFDAVQKQVTDEGKLNIPGRISWRRMYKMLDLPIPDIKPNFVDNTKRCQVTE